MSEYVARTEEQIELLQGRASEKGETSALDEYKGLIEFRSRLLLIVVRQRVEPLLPQPGLFISKFKHLQFDGEGGSFLRREEKNNFFHAYRTNDLTKNC